MRYLYLHGFASGPNSTKGVAMAEHLASVHGARVERLDMRRPSFQNLRGSAMIEHVEQMLDGAPGILMGSSLGGWVALRVAERNPNVRGLVLLAPAIGLAERWKQRMPTSVAQWRQTGWLAVEDHALGGTSEVDIGFMDDMDAIDAAGDPRVVVPVLIVHGCRDDVVPLSGSTRWAADRPNVRVVEVDDGHQLADSLSTILAEVDGWLPDLHSEQP